MTLKPLPLLLIYRCAFILALAFTTYIALVNLSTLPVQIHIWDKLQHIAAFVVLSFLLDHSFPRYRSRRTLHPAQTLFLLGYGIAIEWAQSYIPYRDCSVYDVLADATGLFMYWIFYFQFHTGKPANQP